METMTSTDPATRRAAIDRKFCYVIDTTPVDDGDPSENELSEVDELRQTVDRLQTQNTFLIDRLMIAESNIEMLITMLGARDIPSPACN